MVISSGNLLPVKPSLEDTFVHISGTNLELMLLEKGER